MAARCVLGMATRAQANARTPALTHARTQPCARAHTQKNVILIAFLRLHWFRERASMLRCTYISCLVCYTRQRTKHGNPAIL